MKEADAITTRRHLVIPCSGFPGKVVSGADTVVTVVPIFVQFVLYEDIHFLSDIPFISLVL